MLIGGMMVWAVCVMVACSLVCVGLTMTFLGKFEYVYIYIYIYIYLLSTLYIWYIYVYKYMIVWEFGMIMEVWYDCVKCSRVYLPLYLSVYLTVCLTVYLFVQLYFNCFFCLFTSFLLFSFLFDMRWVSLDSYISCWYIWRNNKKGYTVGGTSFSWLSVNWQKFNIFWFTGYWYC